MHLLQKVVHFLPKNKKKMKKIFHQNSTNLSLNIKSPNIQIETDSVVYLHGICGWNMLVFFLLP